MVGFVAFGIVLNRFISGGGGGWGWHLYHLFTNLSKDFVFLTSKTIRIKRELLICEFIKTYHKRQINK